MVAMGAAVVLVSSDIVRIYLDLDYRIVRPAITAMSTCDLAGELQRYCVRHLFRWERIGKIRSCGEKGGACH